MSKEKITESIREPYDAMGRVEAPNPPAARATLADAQPGGRVMLGGDQLPPLPTMGYEERGTGMGPHDVYYSPVAYTAEQMRDYARAALSARPSPGERRFHHISQVAKHFGLAVTPEEIGEAIANAPSSRFSAESAAAAFANVQPSPGGQDALAYEGHSWVSDYVLADLRERAALPLQLRNGEVWHWQGDGHDFPESLICPVVMSAETLRALLATRQPVGEPEIWVSPGQLEEHKRRPPGQGSNYLPTRLACEGNFTQPLYAAPRAQQPAQVYLDGLDRALGEAIDQRDRYHEVADDLAGHIAAITGVDIGEHSSANCPWQNAIEAAEEYKPAQAVDLPYSLDADPAGIRARVADVITGTLMVGAQGHTPPPAGHWAVPFWQAARHDAARSLNVALRLRELVAASKYMRDRVVETRGVKCMDDLDYAINEADKALIDSQAVGNG